MRHEIRRVRLVEAIYRRKYAGRRMAWLRAECHTHYAGLVVVWRVTPVPIRAACIAVVVFMSPLVVGPWALVPLATTRNLSSPERGHAALGSVLDTIDAAPVLDRLAEYNRRGGPKGYPLRSLWRAHVASFALGLSSTNDLIRLLQDDPELRLLCGFSSLPHRTTFQPLHPRASGITWVWSTPASRRWSTSSRRSCRTLGRTSRSTPTVVDTHANPNRTTAAGECSDPEASWTKKHAASGKEETEWHFGVQVSLGCGRDLLPADRGTRHDGQAA